MFHDMNKRDVLKTKRWISLINEERIDDSWAKRTHETIMKSKLFVHLMNSHRPNCSIDVVSYMMSQEIRFIYREHISCATDCILATHLNVVLCSPSYELESLSLLIDEHHGFSLLLCFSIDLFLLPYAPSRWIFEAISANRDSHDKTMRQH